MRRLDEYTTLKDGFAPVINDVLEDSHIEVRGNTVQLRFFFCGDYKVEEIVLYAHVPPSLVLILSLCCCLWASIKLIQTMHASIVLCTKTIGLTCEVINGHYTLPFIVTDGMYQRINKARTYNSMLQNFNHPKNKKGCINKHLLQFETTNIVIDELHLMLRITDVLLRNLIWSMIQKDL